MAQVKGQIQLKLEIAQSEQDVSPFCKESDFLVYWGLTPQQQPGSYQGGEMMMKSVFWWRKPEYPEETTDLRQVTDETFHTYGTTKVISDMTYS